MTANEVRTYQNYIGGEWTSSVTGELFDSINPANGELVARVQCSNEDDAHRAAGVASEAFYGTGWAFSPAQRAQALFKWAAGLAQRQEELARLLTLESGKPIREARYEVSRAISYLEFYAGLARGLYGASTALSPDSYSILAREPVGTVAVIVPWNFPITLLMRALAPALAAGNAAVVKPAPFTSAVTMACFEELDRTEAFPGGIVNALSGYGKPVGGPLVRDELINMISFTGGTDTGKEIMCAAAPTMKKLALELGGKSANIVFADADLDRALPYAASGIFTNAGQLCTVGSRLLVNRQIQGQVISWLKQRAEAIKVGPGMDESTEMGPLVSESQLERVSRYAEIGKQTARLVTGGQRPSTAGLQHGFFFAPTIFDEAPSSSPIVQEEIFGPVLAVQPFNDEEEAIALANGTAYGLAAGVWTTNVDRALRVARRLQAGTVWINTYNKLAPEVETGGYKESGIGRASGMEGLLEYTEIKHIYLEMGGSQERG